MTSERLAILFALSILPFTASGQTLSITNYQVVGQVSVNSTRSNVTYRADLVNPGPAVSAVSATATSLDPFTIRVVAGQDTLRFAPVPGGSQVTSSNTFTLQVDPSAPVDFSKLQWTFQSSASGPIANAGPNQTTTVGSTVTLNGSGSTNPGGVGTLTYSWAFTTRPQGSSAFLGHSGTVMPTFVVDVQGTYVIMLTVSNGVSSSSASVTVSTGGVPPVANAGPNQTVVVGSTVLLSGSGSTSSSGNPLTYSWTLTSRPAGSSATLSSTNLVTTSFVADKSGSYTAQLVVNDGLASSNPSNVTIVTGTVPPVANAGPNQLVNVGAPVQLNGAGSTDANGLSLTYLWTLISTPTGSAATLNNPTNVNPTFTADRPGTYVAQLVVNNGTLNSTPSTVTITTQAPLAPTANAGANQTVALNTLVTLNGSGTDPQNLPLTYKWILVSKPAGSSASLSSSVIANPTFIPDLGGTYVAQLTVSNGFQTSAPSTTSINTTCAPPVANPGSNQNVNVGTTVVLDGGGSGDVCHDPLTYAWSFTTRPAGSNATLAGANTPSPVFVADVAGTFVVQLIVNNGLTSSPPATVVVNASLSGDILLPIVVAIQPGQQITFPVTLTKPAPAGGVFITLTSSDPSKLTVSPSNVFIAEGLSVSNQPKVTGVSLGSATITASANGLQPASQTLAVSSGLAIAFQPASLTITGNAAQTLKLILSSPAPSGGLTINLSSSNAAVATVPATVNFQAGTQTVNVLVNPVGAGTTTIHASALPNIGDTTASVTVQGLQSLNFAGPLTITAGSAGSLTLNLSGAPAPAGGLTVNLQSSNTAVATVAGTATFAAGSTSVTVPVTGVSGGVAVITASGTGIGSATANVTVIPIVAGAAITIPNASIGQNLQTQVTLSLSQAAPAGGLPVTVTSADPTKVLVAGRQTDTGVPSLTFTVPAGSTTLGGIYLQGLASAGAVNVTAVAPGYQSGSGVITLTPSGFLMSGPGGAASITTNVGAASSSLTLSSARLNAALGFAELQQVRGGFPVSVSVSNPNANAGTVGSPVTFAGGDSSATTTFTPTNTINKGGTTTLTAVAPVGFSSPSSGNTVGVTVNAPALVAPNVTVGKNLETTAHISGAASGLQITLTSSNPSLVLFSMTPTGVGSPSITLTVPPGQNATPDFYVYGVGNTGSATYTAAAAGYATSTGTVTLGPSGFVIAGPGGVGTPTFVVFNANTPITVYSALLDASGNYVATQALLDGTSVNVNVASSNQPVGTISTSPVTIVGGTSSSATQFIRVGVGSTDLTVGTPAGFSTPAAQFTKVTANVLATSFALACDGVNIGQNLQISCSVTIGQPAPAGGQQVTLTSNSPANLLLSSTATGAGSASIIVTIPAGASSATYYEQALGIGVSVNHTASAPGFTSRTATNALVPSGVVIAGPFGLGFSSAFTTALGAGLVPIDVYTAVLDPVTKTFVDVQALRGGAPALQLSLSSSNPAVGTITPLVTIPAGSSHTVAAFTPVSAGSTTISIATPAGFVGSQNATSINAQVTP